MVKEGAQVLAFGAGCGGSLGNYAYMQPFDLEKYVSLVDKGVKPFVMLFERDEFAPVFAEPQYYAVSNLRKTMGRKDLFFLTNQINRTKYAFALSE